MPGAGHRPVRTDGRTHRNRGIRAQLADAQALPFDDHCFDAVVAAWMLYHLPDLDQGLAEVRRVLRPGGVFVAITNGDQHTADLRIAAGGRPKITGFSRENGEQSLRRHFDHVSAQHLTPYAIADHQQAKDYLASFDPALAANLPGYDGERRYTGAVTVFTAR
ncbi:MAG: class I SAM-dependent methyltransferase [Microlunatus sp.]|nr:class I SAM-dependent methyltransferase [Microlunatus sp.]